MESVQKDAIGVVIICTITEDGSAVDVSTVSTKQIILQKPDGSAALTKTASFTNTGTDGKIQYTTISGDLNVTGIWNIQGAIVFSGGFSGRSDVQQFEVKGNLS